MFGRYRIIRKVAEGGMAEVFAAQHESTGRNAALKLLLPEMSVQRDMVKRFFQEAQIAASIDHPGIVKVLDVGYTPDGRAYLVMEMLAGEPMNERLKRSGAQALDVAWLWMRQLAGAIGAAHARGIIHRDLKPGNLFLAPDVEVAGGERIKVLDFGLAKLAEYAGSVLTAQGAIFGTPAYMAPEQCKNAATVDARVDLYAMGCIFYHCVCGRPPFTGNGLQILGSQLATAPVPPRRIRPDIPPDLDALILRLLEKDPERRIQSCTDLIADLDGNGAGNNAPVVVVSGADGATMPVSMSRAPAARRPGAAPEVEVDGAGPHARAESATPWPLSAQAPASQHNLGTGGRIMLWSTAGLVLLGFLVVAMPWDQDDGARTMTRNPATSAEPHDDGPATGIATPREVAQGTSAFDALLAEAEQRATNEEWVPALKALSRASSLDIADQARARRALRLEERVQAELQSYTTFELFKAAALRNDVATMARHYTGLAETSVYRGKAEEERDAWLADMLSRIRASSRRRACQALPDPAALAESLDRLFPEDHPEAHKLRAACAGTDTAAPPRPR